MHVVHKNEVDSNSMIGFPFVIADSEWDMPGIEPGQLGWYTSALTTGLQEVRQLKEHEIDRERGSNRRREKDLGEEGKGEEGKREK